MKKSNEIGKRYGFLIVIKEAGVTKDYRRMVTAKCDCGNEKEYRLTSLKNGDTKSCGCYNRESLRKRSTHGLIKHPIYILWGNMKKRCNDKNDPYYGGCGVTVCKEWSDSFQSFYEWCISNGWKRGLQLDKDILYNKKYSTKIGAIYSPEFCCFVTQKLNSNIRRNSVYYYLNNSKFTLRELSDKFGINYKSLFARIKLGWSIEMAVKVPLRKINKKNI